MKTAKAITPSQHGERMETQRIYFNDVRMKQLATYSRRKRQTVTINLVG